MVARKTRVAQAAQGKFEDAVETQDSRRATAYARFMEAGDEVMRTHGVSLDKRRITAHVCAFIAGCGISYTLGVPLVTAALTLAVPGFIAFVLLMIAMLITWYTASKAMELVFMAIDTKWVDEKFFAARDFVLSFRKNSEK